MHLHVHNQGRSPQQSRRRRSESKRKHVTRVLLKQVEGTATMQRFFVAVPCEAASAV